MLIEVLLIETAAVTSQADAEEAVGLPTDTQDMSDLPELGQASNWLMLSCSGQIDDGTSVQVLSRVAQLAVTNCKQLQLSGFDGNWDAHSELLDDASQEWCEVIDASLESYNKEGS